LPYLSEKLTNNAVNIILYVIRDVEDYLIHEKFLSEIFNCTLEDIRNHLIMILNMERNLAIQIYQKTGLNLLTVCEFKTSEARSPHCHKAVPIDGKVQWQPVNLRDLIKEAGANKSPLHLKYTPAHVSTETNQEKQPFFSFLKKLGMS